MFLRFGLILLLNIWFSSSYSTFFNFLCAIISPMNKIIVFTYLAISGIVAIVTTIAEAYPATIFIDLLSINNRYSVSLTLLLTFILLLLPLLLYALVYNLLKLQKPPLVEEMTGKSGVLVKRKRALQAAIFPMKVKINEEKLADIVLGGSVFIELTPGKHSITTTIAHRTIGPIELNIERGIVKVYNASIDSYYFSK